MADASLSAQVLALGREMGRIEQTVREVRERGDRAEATLAQLGPVQEAIDHLEDRTAGLADEIGAVAPLREALTQLTGQVAQLRQDLAALAAEAEEKVAVWDWSTMNKQEAHQAWSTLLEWVRDVLTYRKQWVGPPADLSRFDFTQDTPESAPRRIPPCWYRHGDVVDELSWLCQEWIKIHRTSYGTPSKDGDWHERAARAKTRILAMMHGCFQGHTDPPWGYDWSHPQAPRAVEDDEKLSKAIMDDLNQRPDATPPGPTESTN